MYKKQVRFQKILCLLTLISGVLTFLYSVGLSTDLYDALFSTMRYSDIDRTDVPGSRVYYDIQDFNTLLVKVSIGFILVCLLLYLSNTHKRRRYYISNYIAVGAVVLYGLVFAVWAHLQVGTYKAQFLKVDFAALKEYSELWNSYYTDSTFWFDIHYLVFGILLVLLALQVYNLVWKQSLMKAEAGLIGKGKEAA